MGSISESDSNEHIMSLASVESNFTLSSLYFLPRASFVNMCLRIEVKKPLTSLGDTQGRLLRTDLSRRYKNTEGLEYRLALVRC